MVQSCFVLHVLSLGIITSSNPSHTVNRCDIYFAYIFNLESNLHIYHAKVGGACSALALKGQRQPWLDFNSFREVFVVVFGHVVPDRLSSCAHAKFVCPRDRIGEGNTDRCSTYLVRHVARASSQWVVPFIAQKVSDLSLTHCQPANSIGWSTTEIRFALVKYIEIGLVDDQHSNSVRFRHLD